MTDIDADEKQIIPRDLNFDFSLAATKWLNEDVYLTQMFNAPSMVLPYVEGFVNFTVIHSLSKLKDVSLHARCLNFIKQEALHAREHVKYNKVLSKQGLVNNEVIGKLIEKLNKIKRKWSLLSMLAIAAGFENFTMTISKIVLTDDLLKNSENDVARFWKWHMMEELEHKSVLMDLYIQLGGGYFRRVSIYTVVLMNYCYYGLKVYFKLLKVNKASRFRGLQCVFYKNSFFIKSIFKSFQYYRYHYHPDKSKTRHLLNFDNL
jgi:uncharacterized protein